MIPFFSARERFFPEGWFYSDAIGNNCISWGNGLNPQTMFTMGARLEVPDLRTADNRTILDLRQQNSHLLTCLQPGVDCMQIHWSVDDDYHGPLAKYRKKTEQLRASGRLRRFSDELRGLRADYLNHQMDLGTRRREVVHVYVTSKFGSSARALTRLHNGESANTYLAGQASLLRSKFDQMRQTYNLANWSILDNHGMASHLRRILNPAMESSMAADPSVFGWPPDRGRSVRDNCLRSDIQVLTYGEPPQGTKAHPCGLYYQGNYHGFFIVRRLPAMTRPGMWLNFFNAMDRCCTVTQTLTPLSFDDEVKRLGAEIEELVKYLADPKGGDFAAVELPRKRARLASLMDGTTQPFSTMTVVRVWGNSLELMESRLSVARSALSKMEGAEFIECNHRQMVRSIFLDTLPGYTHYAFTNAVKNARNTWMLPMENSNLADWMPLSSTFCGHLGSDTQALLDSPGGGVVGMRFLSGGTPQHTSVTGVTGAGKTVVILELLSQIEAEVDYLYIQEEGMAFAPYALVRGLPSVVLRDTSEVTINPFDTFGMPLNSGNMATIAKLGMKLIGASADGDKNSRRENLIGEYAAALYRDTAEDIKIRDEERWYRLTKRAMVADRLRTLGDDFRDGFINMRDLERVDPARVSEMDAEISDAQVIAYQTNGQTRDNVSALVFSDLRPDEYPQWSALISMMKSARFSHHKTGGVADELNYLVSDLARGKRFGGAIGPLLDGTTNVNLHGPGLHFDTSFLSDGPAKQIAGFLFPEMVRKHVMSLPRSAFKLMVLDELRRILLIPGANEYVKEMLAQMRKYKTALIGAFQGASQIDEIDPALTTLIFGQCKQHILMRQNDSSEIKRIAEAIGLPGAAQRDIARHPLIEHQRGSTKKSYFTLFSRDGAAPTCGTVAVEAFPPLVWLASSNGEVFDKKQAILKAAADPVDAIHKELARLDAERLVKAN